MRMPVAIALMALCLVAGFGVGVKFAQLQHPHEDDQTVMNAIMASENQIVGTLERRTTFMPSQRCFQIRLCYYGAGRNH